jgi:hypothetical protein
MADKGENRKLVGLPDRLAKCKEAVSQLQAREAGVVLLIAGVDVGMLSPKDALAQIHEILAESVSVVALDEEAC